MGTGPLLCTGVSSFLAVVHVHPFHQNLVLCLEEKTSGVRSHQFKNVLVLFLWDL